MKGEFIGWSYLLTRPYTVDMSVVQNLLKLEFVAKVNGGLRRKFSKF
ncbi:hypothetical protein [Nodularia sphaerocarpa]|nr:hypothetical protein [Nodularia sphaerocarpa]MDB9375720.1 hypothetical protein [Nodularia sphaerocarpa CS-585]MDB9379839.1 hypothetical protein [Nodularia sphaerocarpa CS-585A2]ULP74091.1 hypothetical protein BDGGKGIB_03752 [Nodularia sphaerocarpa UHCC 0038]